MPIVALGYCVGNTGVWTQKKQRRKRRIHFAVREKPVNREGYAQTEVVGVSPHLPRIAKHQSAVDGTVNAVPQGVNVRRLRTQTAGAPKDVRNGAVATLRMAYVRVGDLEFEWASLRSHTIKLIRSLDA